MNKVLEALFSYLKKYAQIVFPQSLVLWNPTVFFACCFLLGFWCVCFFLL